MQNKPLENLISPTGNDPYRLDKLYIEVTNRCNLDCRTCMRNAWDEPLGFMDFQLFERIMNDLACMPHPPDLFIGGIGEPLAHPRIVDMVRKAKDTGCRVEMISNGILLNDARGTELLDAGLDILWISIDGARPESYSDVRLGDHLPDIIENLQRWQKHFSSRTNHQDELGISFVALKRNIADLPAIVELANRLGARRFSLSNVEAYTPTLLSEMLYPQTIIRDIPPDGAAVPRFDDDQVDIELLNRIKEEFIMPNPRIVPNGGACPFAGRNSLSIRWDGHLYPCLPLMHSHTVHFEHYERPWPEFHLADLQQQSLAAARESDEVREFLKKLHEFNFAPCLTCYSCDLPSENGEDCFGNIHPACGGCLWAQGFIVCP